MRECGIYLGLADDDYFEDEGLGSTDQKKLALDPVEYQWDKRRKTGDEDTKATLWGHALHARALEGRKAFESRFVVAPQQEFQEAGLLVSGDDLKSYCEKLGLKKSGKKADLVARIREVDAVVPIWDEILADAEKANAGKAMIEAAIADQIETAAQWMQKDNYLAPLMRNGTFIEGIPEVSIFADYNGLRLRARIDRLFRHALLDLKSFRPRPGWRSANETIDRILGRIIGQERYDLQVAAYLHIWPLAKELFEAGKVFGATREEMDILAEAFSRDDLKWIWVLVKNTGAPQSFVREFEINSTVFKNALDEILIGLDACSSYRKVFGPDVDWIPQHNAGSLGDNDITIF